MQIVQILMSLKNERKENIVNPLVHSHASIRKLLKIHSPNMMKLLRLQYARNNSIKTKCTKSVANPSNHPNHNFKLTIIGESHSS